MRVLVLTLVLTGACGGPVAALAPNPTAPATTVVATETAEVAIEWRGLI